MVTPVDQRFPLREREGFARVKRNSLNLSGASGLLKEGVS
jgi:hypothetical protein